MKLNCHLHTKKKKKHPRGPRMAISYEGSKKAEDYEVLKHNSLILSCCSLPCVCPTELVKTYGMYDQGSVMV